MRATIAKEHPENISGVVIVSNKSLQLVGATESKGDTVEVESIPDACVVKTRGGTYMPKRSTNYVFVPDGATNGVFGPALTLGKFAAKVLSNSSAKSHGFWGSNHEVRKNLKLLSRLSLNPFLIVSFAARQCLIRFGALLRMHLKLP